MKPIQYYIGILSVLGYVYCLPVVGQVEDKVVRKGNPRLEYTDVKTGRSPEGMGHRTKRILRIERKEYQTY